jgi:hypothetical protein
VEWSPERDLNPRPTAYEAAALATELPGRKVHMREIEFKKCGRLAAVANDAFTHQILDLFIVVAHKFPEDLLVVLAKNWCRAL